MAVFGFQICFTLIMACFMQKLLPIFSLGRWLLCSGSLSRYKPPTNEELKKLSGRPNDKHNSKARNRKNGNAKTEDTKNFKIPKNLDIVLETSPVSAMDTLVLRKYTDYEWIVDYTFFSLLVYAGTEVYYELWRPSKEFNIAMVWVALTMWFAVKNMSSVLWLYAKAKAGGEISMSIAFGMFSFVVALGVLMIKEEILEFGIDDLQNSESLGSRKPFALTKVKLLLAGVSSLIGLLFTFPAIRMAQMYVDALKYSRENQLAQLLLHLNFFAPALVVFVWVKPFFRDLLHSPSVADGDSSVLLTDSQFEMARIVIVLAACFLKVALLRTHLQAYLNIAYDKVVKLKKESGLTTNTDIQQLVSQVYLYLGVVAMQYLSPLVLTLCSVLCLKTLGGYSWFGFQGSYVDNYRNVSEPVQFQTELFADTSFREMVQSVGGELYNLRSVFSAVLMRGVFSYIVWWSSFNWFVASCMGYVYHSYLVW